MSIQEENLQKLRKFLQIQCYQKIKSLTFRFQNPDKSRKAIVENGNISYSLFLDLINDLGINKNKRNSTKFLLNSEESIEFLGGPFEDHENLENEAFEDKNFISGIKSKVTKEKIVAFIHSFQVDYIELYNSIKITMTIRQLFNIRQQLMPVFNLNIQNQPGQQQQQIIQEPQIIRRNNNDNNLEQQQQSQQQQVPKITKKSIQKKNKNNKFWYMNKKLYFLKKDRTTAESGSFEEEEDEDDDEQEENEEQQQQGSQDTSSDNFDEYQNNNNDNISFPQQDNFNDLNGIHEEFSSQNEEEEQKTQKSLEDEDKYQKYIYNKKPIKSNNNNKNKVEKKLTEEKKPKKKSLSEKALEKLSIFEKNKQFLTPLKSDPLVYKQQKEEKQRKEEQSIQFRKINKNHILSRQEKIDSQQRKYTDFTDEEFFKEIGCDLNEKNVDKNKIIKSQIIEDEDEDDIENIF